MTQFHNPKNAHICQRLQWDGHRHAKAQHDYYTGSVSSMLNGAGQGTHHVDVSSAEIHYLVHPKPLCLRWCTPFWFVPKPPLSGTCSSCHRCKCTVANLLPKLQLLSCRYNGIPFAPVIAKCSMVLHHSAADVWSIVGQFGRQALWLGSVEGQQIYTQLLVSHVMS